MRDYRSISADAFVAESIEMKMRWLARRLRWWDKIDEIEQWESTVASLKDLLQRSRLDGATYPAKNLNVLTVSAPQSVSFTNKRYNETNMAERTQISEARNLTIELVADQSSLKLVKAKNKHQSGVNNQQENSLPSERRHSDKRKRDWESRENWKDMIVHKECDMEEEGNQVCENVIRDGKAIGQAKVRIKQYWRQALWRQLETEQKDKNYWGHMHS